MIDSCLMQMTSIALISSVWASIPICALRIHLAFLALLLRRS